MAQVTINNSDTGLAVRTALNAMFGELYSGLHIPVRGEIPTGLINSSNQSYVLAFAPLFGISFYYNGMRQDESQFGLAGQNLTLGFAPAPGDSLRVDYERGV